MYASQQKGLPSPFLGVPVLDTLNHGPARGIWQQVLHMRPHGHGSLPPTLESFLLPFTAPGTPYSPFAFQAKRALGQRGYHERQRDKALFAPLKNKYLRGARGTSLPKKQTTKGACTGRLSYSQIDVALVWRCVGDSPKKSHWGRALVRTMRKCVHEKRRKKGKEDRVPLTVP